MLRSLSLSYRQLSLLVEERIEVHHQRLYDSSGQRILLAQQHSNEERGGPAVCHLGQLHQSRRRVDGGHGDLGEHAADDGCLAQSACAGRAEGQ